MLNNKSGSAPLASLTILLLTSSPSALAMTKDYARQQINSDVTKRANPRASQASICWKTICVERYPDSAGPHAGHCKRYATALMFNFADVPKRGRLTTKKPVSATILLGRPR
jgi:hypothetical protein